MQDVIGLRAIRPDAAVAKVMSLRNSRCIRVVTPDDHVTCGYHEILLHDLGDEDLPLVSIRELDYLRRTWPRAVFAFLTRSQQDLELKRKECKCNEPGNGGRTNPDETDDVYSLYFLINHKHSP